MRVTWKTLPWYGPICIEITIKDVCNSTNVLARRQRANQLMLMKRLLQYVRSYKVHVFHEYLFSNI